MSWRRIGALSLLLCFLASPPLSVPAQDSGAGRDAWQRPEEVMDALGIQAGTVVADVGSGDGYFSLHLARRVGRSGRVYAVDIDKGALDKLRRRAEKEKLSQIETIVGAKDDPRLEPESVDVVLVVNAYHEMRDYDAIMAGMYRALRPGGLLGIIEAVDEPGKPRADYYSRHRLPEEVVREDAERAGFRFLRNEPGFTRPKPSKEFYFLVFEKPVLWQLLPSNNGYLVYQYAPQPQTFLIVEGEAAYLVDLDRRQVARLKPPVPAAPPLQKLAELNPEPLADAHLSAWRLPGTPKIIKGMTWLGWSITFREDGQQRSYMFLRFEESEEDSPPGS